VTVEKKSLAEVVGQNCQRIRTTIGITQDDLARYARNVGLRWTASKVGDFEKGRRAPTFATVLLVSLALHSAAQIAARRGGREVSTTLSELVRSKEEVALNDDVALAADLVSAACRGQPWDLWSSTEPGAEAESSLRLYREMWGDDALAPPERVLLRSGLSEDRLARQLGIERVRLADISYLLWQSTFSEERDRRAGPEANQQKKGRISRKLRAQLEEALADGHD
jgi:transcriptional regulator with XRE-family HTH domain